MSRAPAVSASPVTVIVGGGAAGVLAAAHLTRAARTAGRAAHLLIVEPDELGSGIAYSTQDPRHRLNVRAGGMSAWPDDPQHFARWLRRHVTGDISPDDFVPRMYYG